jgi:hypothetical protein
LKIIKGERHNTMPDYDDAAQRHWDDANHLLDANRLPNADQLFGLSAECALKAIMLALGMKMRNNKPEDKRHGHINVLWDEFISFANDRNQAQYANSLADGSANPFTNWSVHQRYDHGGTIVMQTAHAHQAAARQAHHCLVQARVDGLIG